MTSEATIMLPALGRPWALGRLYDARNDQLIPGKTLWNEESIEKQKKSPSLVTKGQQFKVEQEQSQDDRFNHFDIEASIKCSFLGGLITVGGSAQYLNDHNPQSQAERINFIYDERLHNEELTMDLMKGMQIEHPEVFDDGEATHVCTLIEYGAKAIFVFERTFSSDDEKKELSGHLSMVVKAFPNFAIEGSGEVNMDEKTKAVIEKVHVQYKGDIPLRCPTPVTFTDAIRAYRELPTLVTPESAVPVVVHLYPLCKVSDRACKLVKQIREETLDEVSWYLLRFRWWEQRLKDVEMAKLSKFFPDMRSTMAKVSHKLKALNASLKRVVVEEFPHIRAGKKDESETLLPILQALQYSPFELSLVDDWLDKHEEGCWACDKFFEKLEKCASVVKNRDRLSQVMNSARPKTLALAVTLGNAADDPWLRAVMNCCTEQLADLVPAEADLWDLVKQRKDPESAESRLRIASFCQFATANTKEEQAANFVVHAEGGDLPANIQCSIDLLEGGHKIGSYTPPQPIEDLRAVRVADSQVLLTFKSGPEKHGFVTGIEVQYKRLVVLLDAMGSEPEGTALAHKIGERVQISYKGKVQENMTSYDGRYGVMGDRNFENGNFIVRLDTGEECSVSGRHLLPDVRDQGWQKVLLETPQEPVCKVADLSSLTRYRFRLRVRCAAGFSDFSNEVEVKTTRPLEQEPYNIILCGPTGVGKSTFINAFQNYLQFDTLADAKGNLEACMAAEFCVFDSDTGKETLVTVGPQPSGQRNEMEGAGKEVFGPSGKSNGQSVTQHCQSYLFHITRAVEAFSIRLIDTPGTGDSRGTEQDKQNLQNILDTMARFKKIHAIIFLLKSNEERNTAGFEYCIKSLFKYLHASAARNVLFVMTNSRGTFYAPGGTMTPLRAVLDSIRETGPGVDLQANIKGPNQTVFCIDSESFRYLAALQQGVRLPGARDEDFEVSWERSVSTIKGLVQKVRTLNPHAADSTIGLNKARDMILAMRQPLMDIMETIQSQLRAAESDIKAINDCNNDMQQLQGKLTTRKVFLRTEALGYHRTVCAHPNCVTSDVNEDGIQQTFYNQVCHDGCSLPKVSSYPEPMLQRCWAFRGACQCTESAWCQQCGHGWAVHMHWSYRAYKEEVWVKNRNIEEAFQIAKSGKEMQEVLLRDRRATLKEMETEQKMISDVVAKFAVFLSQCGLAPINNAFVPYIDIQIQREEDHLARRLPPPQQAMHQKVLDDLQRAKKMHIQEVEALEAAMKNTPTGDKKVPTPTEIQNDQKDLFSLKHFGKQLKDACTMQNQSHTGSAPTGMPDRVYGQPASSPMLRQPKGKGKGKGKNTDVAGYPPVERSDHGFWSGPMKWISSSARLW